MFLRRNSHVFFLLLDGEMYKYFPNLEIFLNSLVQIFSHNDFYMLNINLNEIFIELAYYIYDIKFIVISMNNAAKSEDDVLNLENFEITDKMVILIKNDENYNFISKEHSPILTPEDSPIKLLENVINVEIRTLKKNEIEFVDFKSIISYAKLNNIKLKYCLNKNSLCEAIIYKNIYLPVKPLHLKNFETLDIITNLFFEDKLKFSNIGKIIDFITGYNAYIYSTKNSSEDKQLEDVYMKQLSKYISNSKDNLENLKIPDSTYLGNYIRINKFIEVDGNIVSICLNNKLSYCTPFKKSEAEKIILENIKKIKTEIKNPEFVLTRIINISDGEIIFKSMYDPLYLNKVLSSESISYKKDEFIRNLYEKNIYKLFIYQLNDNLVGGNDNITSLLDLDEKIILKNKDKLFETSAPLNVLSDNIYKKDIFYNKNKLIISEDILKDMINLFLSDIKNPFRKDYITNYKYYTSFDNQTNYNSFTNEIIIIS